MYKTVHLMKRRQGMTHEEFVEYYETHHYKFVATIQQYGVTRYVRKYLTNTIHPAGEPEYDCLMELWWESAEAREQAISGRDPELVRVTGEDEVRLFDIDSMLIYSFEESETELPVAEGPPQARAFWGSHG
jgi:EthD domain